ncbi:malectin [Rhincodon typus]|uniref:malectin n=1 Tax=Rhincodon typus TaxID=259920 RepID=UPI00202EC435|nr:malectin [Rhincodon typus]
MRGTWSIFICPAVWKQMAADQYFFVAETRSRNSLLRTVWKGEGSGGESDTINAQVCSTTVARNIGVSPVLSHLTKVFDVRLNGQHVVVKDLDIFEKVGHSTAHDELVSFTIRKGKLSVQGEVSTFNGKLLVEFVKGYYDNPKVCAICIIKGTVEDVPKLLPHPGLEKKEEEEEDDDYEEGNEKKTLSKKKVKSGPRTPDPYASDNSSLMFPILVAFGVFIPTLFCLCRL